MSNAEHSPTIFLLLFEEKLSKFLVVLFFQRWGLDRKGRLAIESYIRGNNLALDVSSVLDGFVSIFICSSS